MAVYKGAHVDITPMVKLTWFREVSATYKGFKVNTDTDWADSTIYKPGLFHTGTELKPVHLGDAVPMPNEKAIHMIPQVYIDGVRVTPRDADGFFLQTEFVSEEEMRERYLPRTLPIEAPWKRSMWK